ncbi:MAG: prephenate dehydrogenase [Firmicutes bacterium]|nr:prephenate dehydrogenase [Bacillota bacterium]
MRKMKVAIIGVGLIGGSIGLGLKAAGAREFEITGIDAVQDSLVQAVEIGAIDKMSADLAVVNGADVVFICTPVLEIPRLAAKVACYLRKGTILTDTGSTKLSIKQNISNVLPSGVHYVGGHPMAGREKSGIAAADKDLFKDKWYIITDAAAASPEAVETVAGLVERIGAKVKVMDAEHHDLCAAVISHVPHVAAAALANLLNYYPEYADEMLNLAGGGFCDTTRIASSDANMWADICIQNAGAITGGLENLQMLIGDVIKAVHQGNRAALYAYFKNAKERRDSIIASL